MVWTNFIERFKLRFGSYFRSNLLNSMAMFTSVSGRKDLFRENLVQNITIIFGWNLRPILNEILNGIRGNAPGIYCLDKFGTKFQRSMLKVKICRYNSCYNTLAIFYVSLQVLFATSKAGLVDFVCEFRHELPKHLKLRIIGNLEY